MTPKKRTPLRRTTNIDPRVARELKPFQVIALDPGGTTGWASASWAPLPWPSEMPTKIESLSDIRFDSGQIGPHEHHLELYRFLMDSTYNTELVCESFQFRQHLDKENTKTKVNLVSNEYIGIVKLVSEMFKRSLTMNTASTGKTFVTDDKLKALGLWTPGQVHANDAKRHLVRYLVVNKRIREPITDKWLDL